MSVFKRANWHSGLTYKQSCPICKTVVTYTDDSLGYRPWFPGGFVYCTTCEKPLRHNEQYALEAQETENQAASSDILCCKKCGKILNEQDKFCSQCGSRVS